MAETLDDSLTNEIHWNRVRAQIRQSGSGLFHMGPTGRSIFRKSCEILLFFCLIASLTASGQSRSGAQSPGADAEQFLTLLVSVREQNGLPLSQQAIVHLSSNLGGLSNIEVTRDAATAAFQNVKIGRAHV